MKAEVLLIRHAESAMNVRSDLIGGLSNATPLSELGEYQAQMLGKYLASNDMIPERVITSPAVRARKTAEIALEAMGIERQVRVEDAVQELSQGDWEGRPHDDVYDPVMVETIQAMNGTFRAPNGESPRDAGRRMYAALETHIVREGVGGPVHVYTHGFAIRSLVGLIHNWDHEQVYRSVTDSTSMTRLEYDGSWWLKDFGLMPEES